MHSRGFLAGTLAGILAAGLAGCGGGSSDVTSPSTTPGEVSVGNTVFSPADVSVTPGTTVTWRWAPGAVEHNVTFDDGEHSPSQSSGTYSRSFAAAATYPYHCTIHGAAVMHGTVTVTSTNSGGTGGSGGGGMGGGGYP
jgi:plastocyanin